MKINRCLNKKSKRKYKPLRENTYKGLTNGVKNERKKSSNPRDFKRYKRATKKQKGIIIDEITTLTGYNRTYASYLLNRYDRVIRVSL